LALKIVEAHISPDLSEEVYASIADTARLDRNYVALVILGALVVASQSWLGG
jgi:hypothetical protein